MKMLISKIGRILRLCTMGLVLLFSQHALAAGTDAGVIIANQAQVDYDVSGVGQTFILSDPGGNSVPGDAITSGALSTDFVVDNRIDFTLVEFGLLTHTPVAPGQQDAFVRFRLQNTGNATQDFLFSINDLTSADPNVHGLPDTDDTLDNLEIYVDSDLSGLDIINDPDFADELIEGGIIDIYVVGDAALTLLDGATDNIELQATVAESGAAGAGAAILTDDRLVTDGLLTVEVVFGDDGIGVLGDGVELAQDGFEVSAASLEITKASLLISDPFNGTTNQKAIPGAIIEYIITVDNTGGAIATNVVITDVLTDITLLSDFFGTNEVEIDNDGAVTTCSQEADADECSLAAGTLTVGVAAPAVGLDVVGGTLMTITFRVTID